MDELILKMGNASKEVRAILKRLAEVKDHQNQGGRFVTELLGEIITYMYRTTQPAMGEEQAKAKIKGFLEECVDLVVGQAGKRKEIKGEEDNGKDRIDDFIRFVPMK